MPLIRQVVAPAMRDLIRPRPTWQQLARPTARHLFSSSFLEAMEDADRALAHPRAQLTLVSPECDIDGTSLLEAHVAETLALLRLRVAH